MKKAFLEDRFAQRESEISDLERIDAALELAAARRDPVVFLIPGRADVHTIEMVAARVAERSGVAPVILGLQEWEPTAPRVSLCRQCDRPGWCVAATSADDRPCGGLHG